MTEDELTQMAAEIERELDAADGFLYQTVEQRRAYLFAALQRVQRASWQPIETAPKDGTPFLAYCPNGYPFSIARWTEGAYRTTLEEVALRERGFYSSFLLTHWMPLPALPGVEEAPRDGE